MALWFTNPLLFHRKQTLNYNPELPKFVRFEYRPQSGHLFVRYLFEEWPGREVEGTYAFQYLGREFFFMYPIGIEYVLLPLGEAANVEEAVEAAKRFLEKWLGHDIKDFRFRSKVAEEIARLEEEKRKEEERYNKEHLEENKRKLAEALEQLRKRSGKG